ncbi:hypothetical protein BH24ACT19_BH24ACT19_22220 [soil metagenome]
MRSHIILATKRESGDFEVPEEFERRLAGPRAPWQLGEPDKTARIRVSAEVFDYARVSHGSAVSLEKDHYGPVLVTRYSGERQLAGWTLSHLQGGYGRDFERPVRRSTSPPRPVVEVDGESADEPRYVRRPFLKEPDFGATSVSYNLRKLFRVEQEHEVS